MTAAVISPSVVGKIQNPVDIISGSNRKISVLYLEGTKATQNDWFLLSNYLSSDECDQVIGIKVTVKASDNTRVDDSYTYDHDNDKLILTGATTGTAYAFVYYYS